MQEIKRSFCIIRLNFLKKMGGKMKRYFVHFENVFSARLHLAFFDADCM